MISHRDAAVSKRHSLRITALWADSRLRSAMHSTLGGSMVEWVTSLEIAEVTRILDLVGVFGSAVLGGAIARAERLDLFGFLVVGVISGLGGGIIRDVLLQHSPPLALTDVAYLPTAICGALLAFIANFGHDAWNRLFTSVDATVLSVWAVAGAQKTLAQGLGWLPAILLGTITAVGGGACRDLLLRRVPAVFGGNALYASVAVVTASIMVVFSSAGVPSVGIGVGILFGAVFRLLAYWRGWGLPNGMNWQPHSRLADVMRRTWVSSEPARSRLRRRKRRDWPTHRPDVGP